MDPSEDNLFAWGSELLLHRTYEPAIQVFQQATQRFPNSPRLWIGLGMALYSRGRYEESIKALLTAADLNPTDPRCYLFLSKAYLSSPNQADDVIQRFRRYAELQPNNALAQYYYAVSLWKGKRSEASSINYQQVESLLQKSVALDGKLAEAHLQLGILYADQHQYAKSFPELTKAVELDPNLPDAHYRLGQYYVHAGQKDRAQQEFQTFQQLQAHHQAEVDKERAEVRQFIYSSNSTSTTQP
jgi:tetratricopeptide (TPR) repeat protein